jgi:hypothetical protein
MHVEKPIDLALLATELAAAAVVVPGVGTTGALDTNDYDVNTWDDDGVAIDLPPEAAPVVEAHVAPPLAVEYAGETAVSVIARTADATPKEVLRFPCEQLRLYQASLTISGVDAGNFVSKIMEGRFTWKRTTASAVMVGITVVSDIHDAAAAPWAPNALASGTDIVFTVTGAAGRTIDWLLVGRVGRYAPGGLAP